MKPDRKMREGAVSPVIAVMLMLVVTIIIAAVVSGFAGNLMGTPENTPQATISAEFSQSKGLNIYHTGGDPLYTRWTKLYLRPTEISTSGVQGISYDFNYTYIRDTNNCAWSCARIVTSEISCTFTRFTAGDVIRINYQNLSTLQVRPDGTQDYAQKSYGIGHPSKIGSTFEIEVYDELNNKQITKTTVVIQP